MCGINGIINFNHTNVNEADLLKMMKLIKHRGPDDQGVFLNKNIVITIHCILYGAIT
jgi:asparagine synthase (glutamine-hydrolysing)